MFLFWNNDVALDMKSGSLIGLFLLLIKSLWPGTKCHRVDDISRRRPCWGFFILVGKNIVTLASCVIHGRVMIRGEVESVVGLLVLVSVALSSFLLMVMMSPEDGSWMV